MSIWRLVFREIAHRKVNFLFGLMSVAVAVGSLVGSMTLLRADGIRTEEILVQRQHEVEDAIAKREKEVAQAGKELQDITRKITKGLGFNILILNKDEDLSRLHVGGTLSKTMPEEYVDELAKSSIVTVNHLLPTIMDRIEWPEMTKKLGKTGQKFEVLLVGTRGEVPLLHRDPKKPLLDAVPTGSMVLGYQIHKTLGLKKDDKVALDGREFTIIKLHEERGTSDDSSIWVNLRDAQEMLGKENLINAILALECNCATVDRVAEIRKEIAAILPGTQVIERGPPALARAEARNAAKATAIDALANEKEAGAAALKQEQASRTQLRQQRENFSAVLVPLVIIACVAWIGFLAFGNVRQRSDEIGILLALGVRSAQILLLFLGKAVLLGIIGAAIGSVAGFGVGIAWGDLPVSRETMALLFVPGLFMAAIVMSPLLSGIASWIPAMLAARQDPATILQGQ